MNALLNAALSSIWGRIINLTNLRTPDNAVGRNYTIRSVTQDFVEIQTEDGSTLRIQRAAFIETMRYLIANQHTENNTCEIRSNQDREQAGPLCRAARDVNGGTRVINYIVPILAAFEILRVDGNRPNTTWLA